MKNKNKIITLAGNPNVGKSTIFNFLTGMNQHTGNWSGKTVANATGKYKEFFIADIPGTYSLHSNSPEEEIARDFLCFEESDYIIVVCDATNLERNLNLVIQIAELNKKTVLCLNMLDEAKKKGIAIDINKLSELLNMPVFGVTAKKGKGIKEMIDKLPTLEFKEFKLKYSPDIEESINEIEKSLPEFIDNKRWIALRLLENNNDFIASLIKYKNYDFYSNEKLIQLMQKEKNLFGESDNISDIIAETIYEYATKVKKATTKITEKKSDKDYLLDKIFTGKYTAIPCMLIFLTIIIWLTVKGANYPSKLLSYLFENLEYYIKNFFIKINLNPLVHSFIIDGIYKVTTWVISVMLPPMAIFFPLFTILEDFGYLPRIAFNLDKCFACSKSCGKQALTMCMGIGCNAVGVTGCRIIDSKRERLIAILTNSFVPCNGRFPSIIVILTIFFSWSSKYSGLTTTLYMLIVICSGILMTFIFSYILSKTLLKGIPSSFTLELPPYRTPQPGKIIVHSLINRTFTVMWRAVTVAIPCGALIWILTNTSINGVITVNYLINLFKNFGNLIGLDGVIISSFILGIPANEIILPLAIMLYSGTNALTEIGNLESVITLLITNGWTIKTALCYIAFTLFHWPCSTTLLTVYKETKSIKWMLYSFIIPTFIGISICFLLNLLL